MLFCQEVKHGPIMPDVAGWQFRDLADVSHNPVDLGGLSTQSGFGVFKGDLRNIKDRH